MQFGVFYEHQLPKPWTDDDEFELLRDALDQVELADRLGFDYAWEVEHHFLDEYSHSSAPEVFLAAAAARTTRIRLGHGIRQVIPNYNHPARTAEGLATLDLISDGRVDFGIGEGATRMELHGFDIPAKQKRAMSLEAGRADRQHDGARPVSRLLVGVVLAAVPQRDPQAPPEAASADVDRLHQPRDHQGRRPQRTRRARLQLHRSGRGPLLGRRVLRHHQERGVRSARALGQRQHRARHRVSRCTRIGPRRSAAGRRASSSSGTRSNALVAHDQRPGRTDLWGEFQSRRSPGSVDRTIADADALGDRYASCIGSPDDARRYLRQMRDVGVDQVIFIQQAGRNRHDDICASLELFAATVLPEFAADEPERQRRKHDELAPSVEAALARKQWMQPLAEDEIPTVVAAVAHAQTSGHLA